MSVFYADTSAVFKLLRDEEDHSASLITFYDTNSDASWVSSTLLRIEVSRAVYRTDPTLLPDARELLDSFELVAINDYIVETASTEPDRMLRSLDAIHLATARLFRTELDGLVTYDARLASAAKDAGMPVVSPGVTD